MSRLMVALAVCALLFTACAATRGPGSDCDPCAQAEANATPGGQAAAASAAGGQRAHQAPFIEEGVSPRSKVTVGRGEGSTRSASADNQTSHVVSGGAQNCGVILPTEALASASGGGVSASVQEASKTAAATRNAWACLIQDPTATTEKVQAAYTAMKEAQASLDAAQASVAVTHTTNNFFQGSRINMVPVSSSSSAGRPDPEVMGPIAQASSEVGTAVFGDELLEGSPTAPSTSTPSGDLPELPPPPAGVAVPGEPESPPSPSDGG